MTAKPSCGDREEREIIHGCKMYWEREKKLELSVQYLRASVYQSDITSSERKLTDVGARNRKMWFYRPSIHHVCTYFWVRLASVAKEVARMFTFHLDALGLSIFLLYYHFICSFDCWPRDLWVQIVLTRLFLVPHPREWYDPLGRFETQAAPENRIKTTRIHSPLALDWGGT